MELELTPMHILMAEAAYRVPPGETDGFHIFHGLIYFMTFTTGYCQVGAFQFKPPGLVHDDGKDCGLKSLDGMAGGTIPPVPAGCKLTKMLILMAGQTGIKFRQTTGQLGLVTVGTLYIHMFPFQRILGFGVVKGFQLFFPVGCIMTGFTILTKTAFMFVFMTSGAGIKTQPCEFPDLLCLFLFREMAADTLHLDVSPCKLKPGFSMVKRLDR
jgi:hypothetical protein